MLIVVVLLCILAVIITYIAYEKEHDITMIISIMGAMAFGMISLGIIIVSLVNVYNTFTIDDKIKLYQEENEKIEKEITTIVNSYQGYEKEIISNVADMEVLYVKIPELRSSELVKTQMQLYIQNNQQIKELKEEKINTKVVKWLLYFG